MARKHKTHTSVWAKSLFGRCSSYKWDPLSKQVGLAGLRRLPRAECDAARRKYTRVLLRRSLLVKSVCASRRGGVQRTTRTAGG